MNADARYNHTVFKQTPFILQKFTYNYNAFELSSCQQRRQSYVVYVDVEQLLMNISIIANTLGLHISVGFSYSPFTIYNQHCAGALHFEMC